MLETETELTGKIDPIFFRKSLIKGLMISVLYLILGLILVFWIGALIAGWISYNLWNSISGRIALYAVVLPIIFIYLCYIWYFKSFIKEYSYAIENTNITINYGVFTTKQIIIPYTRIQNINIVQGLLDKVFGLYNFEIETAGAPVVINRRATIRPEGYIPGMRDPDVIIKKLRKMIQKSASSGSGVENIFFTNTDLALDHFISIFLEKMKEGKEIKNIIKIKRKEKGFTQEQLATKVGTSRQTIIQLESKEYNPSLKLALRIAYVLGIQVEDLFSISEDELDPEND